MRPADVQNTVGCICRLKRLLLLSLNVGSLAFLGFFKVEDPPTQVACPASVNPIGQDYNDKILEVRENFHLKN